VQRWVAHHGFGLNVDERVHEGFETIVACGQRGRRVVSLSEEAGTLLTLEEVGKTATRHLGDLLKFD
jgi:lipoate-protein ligase B